MNESYVLKKPNGLMCGYIMARGKKLCIRLSENREDMRLTVLYEDGEQTFDGGFGTWETEKACKEKKLLGAYGVVDGRMVMNTGETAQKAFEKKRTTTDYEKRGPISQFVDRTKNRDERQAKEMAAERRWPPPPCMPGSKYQKGIWIMETEVR